MSEEAKHTALPWFVDSFRQPIADTGDYDNVVRIRTKGEAHPFPSWVAEVSDCLAQDANANLIVTAVNSHAQLLAACEAALADSVDQWGEGWSLDSPAGMLQEQLRAAIAAAKGEGKP